MKTGVGASVGNVVLRRRIADGGMGTVWVAWHRTLEREVAVKFLAKAALDDPEAAQRFSREARIVAQIHSPHTPELLEHGESDDGTPYLVMDLLHGVDLAAWLATHGRLTLNEVARLVRHVGHALSAAHALGIVHRDVKPTNIILGGPHGNLHAYLIDFGIARSTHPRPSQMVTHPGITIGTPSYMSPEQLMGRAVDERSDVWSLGVVAYRCLTGVLPYNGDNFRETCLAIYCGDFIPVSRRVADVPQSLDAWFSRALGGEPRDRFSSVAEACQSFEAAARDASSVDAPYDLVGAPTRASLQPTLVSVPPPAASEARRSLALSNRRRIAACATGGTILGAVAAFFIMSSGGAGAFGAARQPSAGAMHRAPPAISSTVVDAEKDSAALSSLLEPSQSHRSFPSSNGTDAGSDVDAHDAPSSVPGDQHRLSIGRDVERILEP